MRKLKDSIKLLKNRKSTENESLIDKNKKRVEYLKSFPNVLVYKGFDLPGNQIHSKVLDDLNDFHLKETDVLIVSYPQSGSSLAEDIVSQLIDKIREKTPARRHRDKCQAAKLEADNPYGHIRWLKGLKSPRVLTTNLPIELLPTGVRNACCKIIYLVRNPKDQLISYYYQHRIKGNLSSLDDFFNLYVSGHLLYGDYFSHVIDFWQLSRNYPKNVLFISFEELKLETNEIIKMIVRFLEYELTVEEINELPIIVPKLSKKIDSSSVKTESLKQYQFEGVIGDWINYFTPKQSQQIDDIVKNRLESIGLSLCCDPIEAMKRLSKFKRTVVDTNDRKNQNKSDLSNDSVVKRPQLTKDELKYVRYDSLRKIDIIEESGQTNQTGNFCCFCSIFKLCCPCLFKKIDYTNV